MARPRSEGLAPVVSVFCAPLRLKQLAHAPGPRLRAEVDPVDQFVPQTLLRADGLRHERAATLGRTIRSLSERVERRGAVEPIWCRVQPCGSAIARPAVLLGPLDHLRSHRVEDHVPEHLSQVRLLLDEKGLEPPPEQVTPSLMLVI